MPRVRFPFVNNARLLDSRPFACFWTDGRLAPVNHIRFAHDTWEKTRKNKDTTRSATRSVTSIVYMQHQEHLLASAGSADG